MIEATKSPLEVVCHKDFNELQNLSYDERNSLKKACFLDIRKFNGIWIHNYVVNALRKAISFEEH